MTKPFLRLRLPEEKGSSKAASYLRVGHAPGTDETKALWPEEAKGIDDEGVDGILLSTTGTMKTHTGGDHQVDAHGKIVEFLTGNDDLTIDKGDYKLNVGGALKITTDDNLSVITKADRVELFAGMGGYMASDSRHKKTSEKDTIDVTIGADMSTNFMSIKAVLGLGAGMLGNSNKIIPVKISFNGEVAGTTRIAWSVDGAKSGSGLLKVDWIGTTAKSVLFYLKCCPIQISHYGAKNTKELVSTEKKILESKNNITDSQNSPIETDLTSANDSEV